MAVFMQLGDVDVGQQPGFPAWDSQQKELVARDGTSGNQTWLAGWFPMDPYGVYDVPSYPPLITLIRHVWLPASVR